jgi:hypothetical protein
MAGVLEALLPVTLYYDDEEKAHDNLPQPRG